MAKYEYTIGKDVDLKAEQEKTLQTPTVKATFILRMMFLGFDILYGTKRTLPKLKILEITARYPYWAWENGGYFAISRAYCRAGAAPKDVEEYGLRHIGMGRRSQDNEQCHMQIIADILRQQGVRLGWFKHEFLPRLIAFQYYYLTRFIYGFNPKWSFYMNAAFESHAEHEYMKMVAEHPEWEDETVESEYFAVYPAQKTMADLFRRIGLDERDHMNESLEELERLEAAGK